MNGQRPCWVLSPLEEEPLVQSEEFGDSTDCSLNLGVNLILRTIQETRQNVENEVFEPARLFRIRASIRDVYCHITLSNERRNDAR